TAPAAETAWNRLAAIRLRPRRNPRGGLSASPAVPAALGLQRQSDAPRVPACGCIRTPLPADVGRPLPRARYTKRPRPVASSLRPLRLGLAGRLAWARDHHVHRAHVRVGDPRHRRRGRRLLVAVGAGSLALRSEERRVGREGWVGGAAR